MESKSQAQFDDLIEDLPKILDWIRFGASRFADADIYCGHGNDNPWDEAVQLVLMSLQLPIEIDDRVLVANLTKKERRQLLELILHRVEERKPLPYLFNRAYFAGLPFYVNENVIIPRSPIAELIENRFDPWIEPKILDHPEAKVLDLCTGSACIAIAIAHAFPDAHIDATELSPEALEIAKRNVTAFALENRVHCIQSDLFSQLHDVRYDLIISNPPYVDKLEMEALPQEYKHEPHMALDGGDDGLIFVDKILKSAISFLNEDGYLIVEVGDSLYQLINKYPEVPFTWFEFQRGGHGVFLLAAQQLKQYQHLF